ncbi:cold shock domain-containing protein membrane protein [Pseudomonas sp. GWSMS-1]|uniref:cold shock domain-containing protein membrane protein n=1 Tax=Pseudomonas sp. GWSMS-1 TaxID=3308997 RepID=UPI003CEC8535
MLKIVHLLTGAIALLLSFAPAFSDTPQSLLSHPDALCLALFGLLNLLLAPQLPIWHAGLRHQVQSLVSALLVIGSLLQALILLAP